ncbi:MAG: ribosome biogenesis GTPase YlqF [Eubacterium sp.]|nr:ribosome biogenesis GTPase YlqF [Eubacterium sp.]
MDVQWYPGHMTKARREMQENLKLVDLVMELIDARAPLSGRNPDIRAMENGKSVLLILNKADLADPESSTAWEKYYRKQGLQVLCMDSRKSNIRKQILALSREACHQKLERDKRRGIRNSKIRVMVAGIPNVGKSTLINSLAGRASARTGDKPGVTRGQQWIHLGDGLDLLDTPGILWPKFDDPEAGMRLAWIGSVKDDILPTEELALHLVSFLRKQYGGRLSERYGINEEYGNGEALADQKILAAIAESRGCLLPGNRYDTEKAALLLLDDFRHARLGRITVEQPPEEENE